MKNSKFQLSRNPELERKIAVQHVIDRILEHGDDYLNKLNSFNSKFNSPHQYSVHKNQILQSHE